MSEDEYCSKHSKQGYKNARREENPALVNGSHCLVLLCPFCPFALLPLLLLFSWRCFADSGNDCVREYARKRNKHRAKQKKKPKRGRGSKEPTTHADADGVLLTSVVKFADHGRFLGEEAKGDRVRLVRQHCRSKAGSKQERTRGGGKGG